MAAGVLMMQSHGGRVDARVFAAVEEELRALSTTPPQLPWVSGGKGGAPGR